MTTQAPLLRCQTFHTRDTEATIEIAKDGNQDARVMLKMVMDFLDDWTHGRRNHDQTKIDPHCLACGKRLRYPAKIEAYALITDCEQDAKGEDQMAQLCTLCKKCANKKPSIETTAIDGFRRAGHIAVSADQAGHA